MKDSYLVLGAGPQGSRVAYDLLQRKATKKVVAVDGNKDALKALEERLSDRRLYCIEADVSDRMFLKGVMHICSTVISCLPYEFNLLITKIAVTQGKNMVDLGGNNDVVEEQFALGSEAKKTGSRIVPDCGIAPGAVSIVAADGIMRLGGPENTDSVRIYCGGIPVYPQGILNYRGVFSRHGWINECKELCEAIRDHKLVRLSPMTELESMDFPEPFGTLEAVHTSGGISRSARFYEGRIREMQYKTLRYPGHWQIMALLNRLGYLSEEKVVNDVTPRQISEEVLGRHIDYESIDAILTRWVIDSVPEDGKRTRLEYNLICIQDSDYTAMQVMTADSASIVAQMLENNTVKEPGVHPQEAIPSDRFIRQWARRGIRLIRDKKTIQQDI